MSRHQNIKRHLVQQWAEGQGKRAAGDVPELMGALLAIVGPLADMECRKDEPKPIVLTRRQVRDAYHRAISQARRAEFGPIDSTLSAEQWLDQIKTISSRWGLPANLEEWSRVEPQKEAA